MQALQHSIAINAQARDPRTACVMRAMLMPDFAVALIADVIVVWVELVILSVVGFMNV